MVLLWLSRPFKEAHTVAQLVTQRQTDRWTVTRRGCAGTSLWAQVHHAWMFNLVMHSAMQAPPRYALKTSLLTRTTWTLACLLQNKLGFVLLLETPILMVSNLQFHSPSPCSCFEWTKRRTASSSNNTQQPRMASS